MSLAAQGLAGSLAGDLSGSLTGLSPVNPAQFLGANLGTWWRWDLGYTLASGRVSSWADQAATDPLDVTQVTAGKQPLWVGSGGALGRGYLDFDASRVDSLTKSTDNGIQAGTGIWYVVIGAPDVVNALQRFIVARQFGAGEANGIALNVTAAGKAEAALHDGTSAKAATGTTGLVAGTTYVIEGYLKADSTLKVAVNGTVDGSAATAATTLGQALECVGIGTRTNGTTEPYDGKIYEFFIGTVNPLAPQFAALQAYAFATYGITMATRT